MDGFNLASQENPATAGAKSMNDQGQTICLAMIVKDEAPVIRRCLDSVRPWIDSWAIQDTGSTDDTREIILDAMKDLPGILTERPWFDFARNRTEALREAEKLGDFTLIIDADDRLDADPGFRLPRLDADSYDLDIRYGDVAFRRKQVVRNSLPWRYVGVLHEYLECDSARTEAALPGLRYLQTHDGARSRDPLTYRRDALTLERALLDEPDNTRYVFYLAQSYRDANDLEAALKHYRRRASMGGWIDEVWCSLYQAALMLDRLGKPRAEVAAAFLAAYQFGPSRAEPLYRVGMLHQGAGEYHLARLYLGQALAVPTPRSDRLFVEAAVYDHLIELEYAVSCYHTGDHAGAIAANDRLLRRGSLPDGLVELVARNRQFSLRALSHAA